MIYFVNFQDNNLDKVNDVNDVLDKCVKNDNLDNIDNTCKSVASLKTESVSSTYLPIHTNPKLQSMNCNTLYECSK